MRQPLPGVEAESWAYRPATSGQRRIRQTKGRPYPAVRWMLAVCLWTLLGVGAGVLLSVSLPLAIGYRAFTVMSGSMEPAIHTGDVVVNQRIAPEEARVGDVITYRDPEHPSRLVTHRVRGVRTSGDRVLFVTKGDANNDSQKWTISRDGSIGRVRYRVVRLGYVLFYVNRPIGRFFLILAPILILSWYEIAAIWRKEPKRKEHEVVVSS